MPMWTGFGVAALGACLAGCQVTPFCEELEKCGGDVMAGAGDVWKADGILDTEWIVTGNDACIDPVQRPLNPFSLARQPQRPAGERPVDRATLDWCSGLAIKQDGTVIRYDVWDPTVPFRNGSLLLSADGTYAAQFTAFAHQRAEFSASCLTAQGVPMTCAEFGRQITVLVKSQANLYNMRCFDGEDHGCACDYELSLTAGPNGRWERKGTMITFFDELAGPPSLADYCLKGDTLELTGQDGMRLFNKTGLRTINFRRPTCSDGMRSKTLGENGVDCGGQCGGTCPSCTDGVQNGDEEGPDCGGTCALGGVAVGQEQRRDGEICACLDKVKNEWEEDVDCGGPCDKCTCFNGMKDNEEEDIDCGGIDCSVPCTCRNGMKDPNEAGVDCGRTCKKDCP
jgi:hypothetical protein